MPVSIDPLQIGLVLAVVGGAATWYFTRKNRETDKKSGDLIKGIRTGVSDCLDKEKNLAGMTSGSGMNDVIADDEPDVPKLTETDQQDVKPLDPETLFQHTESVAEPQVNQPEPVQKPEMHEAGRQAPCVDSAIEAVVHFTAPRGRFDKAKVLQIANFVEQANLGSGVTLDYYDADKKCWYFNADTVSECSQIYLSLLLANRSHRIDEMLSSRFIGASERIAIELDAEANQNESASMIVGAENIERIIKAFDTQLVVKIVAMHDIHSDDLQKAATACGLTRIEDGCFAMKDATGLDPVIILSVSANLSNELELKLDVPLAAPANSPLAAFFALANDLCCRIDGMLVDASGTPIGSPAAAYIDKQLKELQSQMTKHGVPAGSRRAKRIFSRM